MAYVWTCTDYDRTTETCVTEGWVMSDTWVVMLPTIEEANIVGGAMFAAICIVMAMGILFPPRDRDD